MCAWLLDGHLTNLQVKPAGHESKIAPSSSELEKGEGCPYELSKEKVLVVCIEVAGI
jgi:hypothetical protein